MIADTSAWSAYHRKPSAAPSDWESGLKLGTILTSPVVNLELLHSTRSADEFEEWEARLAALRESPLTREVGRTAVGALRELAHVSSGYHRVGLGDALIAASALPERGVDGVLHYNYDFDRLAEVLPCESIWLAQPPAFEDPFGTPERVYKL